MNEQSQPVWLLIAVAVLFFLAQQRDREPDVSLSVTHVATVEYSQRCAALLDEAADMLESGELKNDRDFRDWLDTREDEARVKAFRPVGEALNAIDEWPDDAPVVLRKLAEGHRKVR